MDTPRSLLDRLRGNSDAHSWSRLFTLYSPWVQAILQRAGVDPADRDDLQQEAFAVLAREVSSFEHNGRAGAFRSWFKAVVFHRLQHHRRSQFAAERHLNRDVNPDLLEDQFSEVEAFWDQEHDRHVIQELMKLVEPTFSPTIWKAFQRQVFDDWKAADTARELGISVNSALLAKSRVLRRLRDEAAGLVDEF